jgi:hypothetical protein
MLLTFSLVGLFHFAERRWLQHLAPRKNSCDVRGVVMTTAPRIQQSSRSLR